MWLLLILDISDLINILRREYVRLDYICPIAGFGLESASYIACIGQ